MPLSEDDALLVEIMLQSELFCAQVEALGKKKLPLAEMHTLSLKISQCRGILTHLQEKYDEDKLTTADSAICADVRNLIMCLMWVNFLGRALVDFKLCRKLVQIESGFTYLLISGRRGRTRQADGK
jgi:hypothetical protein